MFPHYTTNNIIKPVNPSANPSAVVKSSSPQQGNSYEINKHGYLTIGKRYQKPLTSTTAEIALAWKLYTSEKKEREALQQLNQLKQKQISDFNKALQEAQIDLAKADKECFDYAEKAQNKDALQDDVNYEKLERKFIDAYTRYNALLGKAQFFGLEHLI